MLSLGKIERNDFGPLLFSGLLWRCRDGLLGGGMTGGRNRRLCSLDVLFWDKAYDFGADDDNSVLIAELINEHVDGAVLLELEEERSLICLRRRHGYAERRRHEQRQLCKLD